MSTFDFTAEIKSVKKSWVPLVVEVIVNFSLKLICYFSNIYRSITVFYHVFFFLDLKGKLYLPVSFLFPHPTTVHLVPTARRSPLGGRQIGRTWSLNLIVSRV